MKKRISRFLLLVTTLTMVLITTGCNKNSELDNSEAAKEQPLEALVQTIKVEQKSPFSDLTKEVLFEMDRLQFQEYVENNIPNYREFFKIEDDYVIVEEDWDSMKEILALYLFKESPFSNTVNGGDSNTIVETDPNEIYYNPSKEYISALSQNEFKEYMSGLQKYLSPDSEAADFSKLTPEQVEELRKDILDNIE